MAKIVISGSGSISALGNTPPTIRAAYASGKSEIKRFEIGGELLPAAPLHSESEAALSDLQISSANYRTLDRSVQLAILAARAAVSNALFDASATSMLGVNIGSSRGATDLFERGYSQMQRGQKLSAQTSPTTTLGNVSSWVAQDLLSAGLEMSHSVTCATGLHSVLNAFAWIGSGMAKSVLAGATEAPLTPFTIAQMKALRIYSQDLTSEFPCRPLGVEHATARDGMVLGEAAAVLMLEEFETALARGVPRESLIEIEGFGFAMESIQSPTSISEQGTAFESAMRNAIANAKSDAPIDCVVMHAPGTVKGDRAELLALDRVFANVRPCIVSNKWIAGHTFAAAGLLGIELATLMLNGMPPLKFPYPTIATESEGRSVRRVMVNAAGFGGNAVSIILKKF